MEKIGAYTLQIMRLASWYNGWLFSWVKPYLTGEILEVGAGIGNFTQLLLPYGSITAIDYDASYVERLKKIRTGGKKLLVGSGDIEKGEYFFKKKEFDTIVCLNVLEHTKGDIKALKNMHKLLRREGRLILLVPAHPVLFGLLDKSLGHIRRYTKSELMKKLNLSGFKILAFEYLNGLGALGWLINAKILRKSTLPEKQLILFDKISRPFLSLEKVVKPPFGLSILAIAIK